MFIKLAKLFFKKRQRLILWRIRENFLILKKNRKSLRLNLGIFGTIIASVKIALKERDEILGRLDYPKADIFMELNSLRAIKRLGASKKEPETVAWIESEVKAGDVFYDIGANVGAFSFIALAVAADKCKVYSFEPGVPTFATLCRNVFINKAEGKIIPIGVALSNKTALNNLVYSSLAVGEAQHGWGGGVFRWRNVSADSKLYTG